MQAGGDSGAGGAIGLPLGHSLSRMFGIQGTRRPAPESERKRMDMNLWRDGVFKAHDRLITITVRGKRLQVPENNTLLRCLQYADADLVTRARYCWNGDCNNCQVWYDSPVHGRRTGLACKINAIPEMTVTSLSPDLEMDLEIDLKS